MHCTWLLPNFIINIKSAVLNTDFKRVTQSPRFTAMKIFSELLTRGNMDDSFWMRLYLHCSFSTFLNNLFKCSDFNLMTLCCEIWATEDHYLFSVSVLLEALPFHQALFDNMYHLMSNQLILNLRKDSRFR